MFSEHHFNGSYGLHVTENCPSLVRICVRWLRGALHLCDLHAEHDGDSDL